GSTAQTVTPPHAVRYAGHPAVLDRNGRYGPACGSSPWPLVAVRTVEPDVHRAPFAEMPATPPRHWLPSSKSVMVRRFRRHQRGATSVDELIDWYLIFARDDRGLEHSTLVGYREVYATWLKPHFGHLPASRVKEEHLEATFGRMRRAGLSHSRMNN